ncbi:hypothetical protein FF098_012815 [Parvularcula flava]|uniref:Lipoprotein n=1 Tax=Aquisalinus luteolus TaxID=1566827 RepID=A0A8J3EV70_9PROT|nr:hypothetical protein [Aquisalinus luteolus]NHK28795.1 hypothetical protein [Aquisalinus luteolus]GGH99540.1 hypothetical protein GCM10011355_25740 [Aquisalinus luteolus]
MPKRLILSLGLVALVAACGNNETDTTLENARQAEQAQDAESAIEDTPDNISVDDTLLTGAYSEGEWVYKAGDPAALYGPPSTDAIFSLWCDTEVNELIVQRAAEVVDPDTAEITIVTPEGSRKYYVQSTDGPMPLVTTGISLEDMFVDDIAQAARFAVSGPDGSETLRLPGGPEVVRLVQACRRSAY